MVRSPARRSGGQWSARMGMARFVWSLIQESAAETEARRHT